MTVLRYERRYPDPIEKVWDAITQPERLVAWLGEAEIELEQGGRSRSPGSTATRTATPPSTTGASRASSHRTCSSTTVTFTVGSSGS